MSTLYDRMQNATTCPAFRWIGQPWYSCDDCGKPHWEHTHFQTVADGAGPFSGKMKRILISPRAAAETRRIWWSEDPRNRAEVAH
jgi:hypothetical protein